MNETKKPSNNQQDQFKSTKKWNEIIDSFCGSMPLRRHWRNFRTYTDCFNASEAIDWVYRYLKSSPNFQHLNISRQNAIKLLQIFLKERIIEDVRSGENFTFKEFQDDDRVYRFCTNNPNYLNRTSNNSVSSAASSMIISSSAGIISSGSGSLTLNTATIEISSSNSTIDNFTDKKEKKLHTSCSQANFNTVLNEKQLNNQHVLTKSDNEKMNLNSMNLAQATVKKKLGLGDQSSKENTIELKRLNSKARLVEFEIWSKISRKMLESIIRKAVLNNSIGKPVGLGGNLNSSKIGNMFESNEDDVENQSNVQNSNDLISPKSSSTLKRSTDIKIGLGKLLDKRSHDILMNLSGSNIEHNCNNINKHGVVINTNGESDNDEEYPKFDDVYQEIVDYFKALDEPLLTNDLSYLFAQILNLLLVKPDNHATNKKQPIHNGENSKQNLENCADSIDELIQNLKNQLKNLSKNQTNDPPKQTHRSHNHQKSNSCSTHKLLDIIANASNDIKNGSHGLNTNKNEANQTEYFDQVEAKLIENAKLPMIPLDTDDAQTNIYEEINDYIGANRYLNNDQKEVLLHNLLLASVAKLENCCDECLTTYNEINEFINSKSVELDEFLLYLNNEEMIQEQELLPDPKTQCFLKNSFFSEHLNHMNELTNEYEDEDLIDIDDYDEYTNTSRKKTSNRMNERESFIDSEMTSTSLLISSSNHQMNDSVIKPVNKLLTKSLSDKRLHRNNSFRAAIGDIPLRLNQQTITETSETASNNNTPKKSLIIRSSTNNSSDFNYSRPEFNKTEILYDPNSNDVDFVSYQTKLRAKLSSSTLNINDDFNFKLPKPVDGSRSRSNISKSISMNFKSEFDMPDLRKQKWGASNRMTSLTNIDESRKRKASYASSSTESISSIASTNQSIQRQPNKLNRNDSVLGLSTKTDQTSTCSNTLKATSSTNIYSHRKAPSMSLSSLDQINTSVNLNGSVSLRNLSNNLNQSKQISNLSLNELSMFIRSSLNKNQKECESVTEAQNMRNKKTQLSLSAEIESDLFYFIISAFRLLALMLPPSNKRKLHFLLRFLNKLKYSKQSAKYLLTDELSPDYLNQLKDLNYIDASYLTTNSFLMNNLNETQSNNSLFYSSATSTDKPPDTQSQNNKHKRRSNLNKDLEIKSNAIESIIIKSFVNSIVKVEKQDDLMEELGAKLAQILINNYSEIMRIPEDLISNVKQKINASQNQTQIEKSGLGGANNQGLKSSSSSSTSVYCSKISLQEYDKQKAESKQYLANLLDNIVKDINMNEDEKLVHLKKFKESHPLIYQENQKIKKALNILGLNDSISYLNLNQTHTQAQSHSHRQHPDTDLLKKKVFLTSLTDSAKKANLFGSTASSVGNKSTVSGTSSCLNQTTISSFPNTSKNSLNFPKFFLNKKWKKENLI